MNNLPKVKIGIVGVSRDCFPAELTIRRRAALVKAYEAKYDAADIYECPVTIIESEIDMKNALADIKAAGCNALCVYLGNFGPEISETMLIQQFDGPAMLCAAAEEDYNSVTTSGRGDAYCGMLNIPLSQPQKQDVSINQAEKTSPRTNTIEECVEVEGDMLPTDLAVELIDKINQIMDESDGTTLPMCFDTYVSELRKIEMEIKDSKLKKQNRHIFVTIFAHFCSHFLSGVFSSAASMVKHVYVKTDCVIHSTFFLCGFIRYFINGALIYFLYCPINNTFPKVCKQWVLILTITRSPYIINAYFYKCSITR